MKKEKYGLSEALYFLFKKENKLTDVEQAILMREIMSKTGLSFEEFEQLACQNQTVGQLKYRILGLMDKKKIDSSHII